MSAPDAPTTTLLTAVAPRWFISWTPSHPFVHPRLGGRRVGEGCQGRRVSGGEGCQVPFRARNITTTNTYDALNRLLTKTYANDPANTPAATFSYDQTSVTIGSWSSGTLTNPKGRLTETTTTTSGGSGNGVRYPFWGGKW